MHAFFILTSNIETVLQKHHIDIISSCMDISKFFPQIMYPVCVNNFIKSQGDKKEKKLLNIFKGKPKEPYLKSG